MAFYNIFMYFKGVFQMRRSYSLRKGEISIVDFIITCIIIMIIINCNWVITRWQWLYYMHTNMEIKKSN